MVTQIDNGLQPTRNLKTKYMLNSKCIKQATEHHEAGILSVWQFLTKCSHSSATYERRQRNWALGILNGQESDDGEVAENDLNEISPVNIEMEQNDEHEPNRPSPSVCMTCNIVTTGENVAQYIVLPCGHAWVCTTCVGVLENQTPVRCPMCRVDVNVFQRIFIN